MKNIFVEFIVSVVILVIDMFCIVYVHDVSWGLGYLIGVSAIIGLALLGNSIDRFEDLES